LAGQEEREAGNGAAETQMSMCFSIDSHVCKTRFEKSKPP
jgi:hypothetical protein